MLPAASGLKRPLAGQGDVAAKIRGPVLVAKGSVDLAKLGRGREEDLGGGGQAPAARGEDSSRVLSYPAAALVRMVVKLVR